MVTSVLHGEMTVVPAAAVLDYRISIFRSREWTTYLHSPECVLKGVLWCDRTLGNAIDPILVHRQPLTDSMPVNAGAIVLQLISIYDFYVLKHCK
jgi:hypothetical protein